MVFLIHAGTMHWVEKEFANLKLGDKRLVNRFKKVCLDLSMSTEGTVNRSISNWADKKGCYRLFSNEEFDPFEVMKVHKEKTKERMSEEKVVLSLNDSSFMSFTGKKSIKGLGNIGGKNRKGEDYEGDGFIFHTALGVTTEGLPLGIQSFLPYSRGYEKPWDVESERWHASFDDARETYGKNTKMIYVADREADQYELMSYIVQCKKDFVIRSKVDRMIHGTNHYLQWEIARESKKYQTTYFCPELNEDIDVEIKFGPVSFNNPKGNKNPGLRRKGVDFLELNYIEIKRVDTDDRWVLLTSLEVKLPEDALKVMHYYRQRWQIEEYFKILKGGGLKYEKSNLRTLERLIGQLATACVISWRVYYLQRFARLDGSQSAKDHFRLSELQAIALSEFKDLNRTKFSLREALGYIAKLGGYNKQKNDRGPGPITLYRGMVKIEIKADAIDDMKELAKTNPEGLLNILQR